MKNLRIQCEHGNSQIHVRCVTAGVNLHSKPDMQDLWENQKRVYNLVWKSDKRSFADKSQQEDVNWTELAQNRVSCNKAAKHLFLYKQNIS